MHVKSVLVLLVALILAVVSALPALQDLQELQLKVQEESEPEPVYAEQEESEERGLRFARATCDFLSLKSKIGSLEHAACAAHCLAMRKGYRGGSCKSGVCHCRR